MKNILPVLLLISLMFYSSCSKTPNKESIEKWKIEIVNTEKEFANMAQKEGIPKAFLMYAADDAVLLRGEKLIIGKESIRASYKSLEKSENTSLTWSPDFVNVSSSGDLGYTYGRYVYSVTDSLGNTKSSEGVFHSVWKRQPDGNWRFVWD